MTIIEFYDMKISGFTLSPPYKIFILKNQNKLVYFSLVSSFRSHVASSILWFCHKTLTKCITLLRSVFSLQSKKSGPAFPHNYQSSCTSTGSCSSIMQFLYKRYTTSNQSTIVISILFCHFTKNSRTFMSKKNPSKKQ